MFDEELHDAVLKTLGLEDANQEDQDIALEHLESIAQKRLARALPEMLNDEQLQHVETMRTSGKSEGDIVKWIQEQVPQYDEMLSAVIMDVADEIAKS